MENHRDGYSVGAGYRRGIPKPVAFLAGALTGYGLNP
jgi:hypothetical protein